MDKPLVSIIIVNWNGGQVFQDCLASLSKIDYPNWELIVVDNGSTDGSERLPSNYKLIKNKTNLGFAKANNQGYEVARGKYLLLLNNDTLVEKDFLSKLAQRLEIDNTIGVIQPKIYLMDKKGYLDNAGSFLTRIGFLKHCGFGEKDSKEFDLERQVFSVKGACILIRKEIIDNIGLFDTDFFSYFEESDFCWRVWLYGFRVIYYPKAVIYHKLGFTIKRLDVLNLNFYYYKNRISSLIKNLEWFNLLTILISHLLISFGISLLFLKRWQPKNSGMILAAIKWNIFRLPSLLKKRKEIQKVRKIKDKELFKIILQPVNFRQFYKDFKRVEKDIKDKKD